MAARFEFSMETVQLSFIVGEIVVNGLNKDYSNICTVEIIILFNLFVNIVENILSELILLG
jgi:hypothetical protein